PRSNVTKVSENVWRKRTRPRRNSTRHEPIRRFWYAFRPIHDGSADDAKYHATVSIHDAKLRRCSGELGPRKANRTSIRGRSRPFGGHLFSQRNRRCATP